MKTFAAVMTTLVLISFLTAVSPSGDTLAQHLPDVTITAQKERIPVRLLSSAVSSVSQESMHKEGTYRPFIIKVNGRIALVSDRWEVYLRADNLTDRTGRSFYFKSMGNEFFASIKPRIIMTGITIKL